MEKRELKIGDIVQIDPHHDPVFGGHFMVVIDPKSWGAQGYCPAFPYEGKDGRVEGGLAYYRCKFENMELVGSAEWVWGYKWVWDT